MADDLKIALTEQSGKSTRDQAQEEVEQAYQQFRSPSEKESFEFGELGAGSIDDFSWF